MSKITPTEEWQKAVKDHIDKLEEDEKRDFAYSIIFDVALWTGYNGFEMVGILECVKADLLDTLRNAEACDGNCDDCDKNDEK
jgi:hypothetical protein